MLKDILTMSGFSAVSREESQVVNGGCSGNNSSSSAGLPTWDFRDYPDPAHHILIPTNISFGDSGSNTSNNYCSCGCGCIDGCYYGTC